MKNHIYYILIVLLIMNNFPLCAVDVNANIPNKEELEAAGIAQGKGWVKGGVQALTDILGELLRQQKEGKLSGEGKTLLQELKDFAIQEWTQTAGDVEKEATKRRTLGGLEGYTEAAESQEAFDITKRGFTAASQRGSEAFSEAMREPETLAGFEEAARAGSEAMGVGAKSFSIGFKKEVAPHIKETFQDLVGSFISFENAVRFGTPIALGIALPMAGYYGSRTFWNVLEKRLLNPKPKILLPGSVYGRTDRIKRWWAGYKSPAAILDQQVKDRLLEIIEKTKNIKEHIYNGKKVTYDNLLLYGDPGTGKTLFAQILADETDMDFLPVTAASLLQSGVEGIKYFDELLDMANRSKYGVIIFVDEADALFINRDSLSPESDHYKVLNHILALTGNGSNKFMLVAATNHAYMMDQAMGRRFQDRVLMPLPGAATRRELIDLYLNQTLFNEKENSADFVATAHRLLTNKVINDIVEQTAGLSHAEIKDMIVAIGKKASATKDGMIVFAHIQRALKEAIEKKRALEADKLKMEQKKGAQSPA